MDNPSKDEKIRAIDIEIKRIKNEIKLMEKNLLIKFMEKQLLVESSNT